MKREYKKPVLAVESFQLNAAIAGSCAGRFGVINHGVNTCKLVEEITEGQMFYEVFGNACAENVNSSETYCYHGPMMDMAEMFLES